MKAPARTSLVLPAAALSALLAVLSAFPALAQVQIVRELPQTGDNQAQAHWGPPLPSAQAPSGGGVAQLSGRLSLGGSGGIDDTGAQTLDANLEGNLSLLLPFRSSSSFLLTADALRQPGLEGLAQDYKAAAKLTLDALQAEVGGDFHQQARNEATGSTAELSGSAHASVVTSVIPTLPMSIAYSFQRLNQNESDFTGAFAQITDSATHQAQLKGTGTLGTVGVDTGASFTDMTDFSKGMETTAFGGNLGVTVPIASFLKAFATVTPKYDATSYAQTGNSAANTSLESDAGFLIPISEPLSFKIGAGRIDQWSAQTGPSANTDPTVPPYSVTWKGLAGLQWAQGSAASASATYGFGKTVAGPFVHSLDAVFGYHGEKDSFVRDLAAEGSYTLSLDDTGAPVDSQASWKTSAGLGSQDALALNASYSGSAEGFSQTSLTNSANLNLTHQIIPELSYALGANLTQSEGADLPSTLLQSYQGKLTVAPRLGDRTLTFTADDILALDVQQSPALIVSKAGAGIAAPLFMFLSTRERFDWEWDSATAPGAGPGNAYTNTFGLTLSSQKLPVSLTAAYALSFGFRGLRHDVSSTFDATLWKGFSLGASLVLSEFDAGSGPTVPFIASLTAAYSF